MKSELVTKAATRWLNGGCERFPIGKDSFRAALFWRITDEISLMLRERLPDGGALRRVGELFDELAHQSLPHDTLGERNEIGANLAFLGWRTSYLLGYEKESQQWIRIGDLLVSEAGADFERLEAYLYLPERQKSKELSRTFLSTSLDLFLSLAILRRDRLRKPLAVIAAAENIYGWVTSRPVQASGELAFFAGEAAWLVAAVSRMLGRRAELSTWLHLARKQLRRMSSREGFRARLHLVTAMKHLIDHRHRHLVSRLQIIKRDLLSLGMYHEGTICRLAIAEVTKLMGGSGPACAKYREIATECHRSSMTSVAAISFANIAQFHTERGEEEPARAAHAEALEIGDPTDLLTLSSVVLSIASSEVAFGRIAEGARLYEVAAQISERIGARYWHAYARVLEAEALVSVGRFASALEALAIAVPVIRKERMAVEGMHAMNLLSRIASSSAECGELVFDLIAQVNRD
ncbi:MAG: hypothetical protein M3167_11905 [Acidobacteriota bacterium]|nr:hypothetical protein [Acidobacteriota bacterium]